MSQPKPIQPGATCAKGQIEINAVLDVNKLIGAVVDTAYAAKQEASNPQTAADPWKSFIRIVSPRLTDNAQEPRGRQE